MLTMRLLAVALQLVASDAPLQAQAAALRFAPYFVFHPDERYAPLAIESLLAGATLVEGGSERPSPLPDSLVGREGHLRLAVAQRDAPAPGTAHLLPGRELPLYVAMQRGADGTFVDLHYILLFGHQGPQVVRFFTSVAEFVAAVPHYGEHQADLERLTVRVDVGLQRVLQVRFEAHGKATWFPATQVDFVAGAHPRVLCALNNHALINPALRRLAGKEKLQRLRRHKKTSVGAHPFYGLSRGRFGALGWGIDMVDLVDLQGPSWQASSLGALRGLGLDAQGSPLGPQRWAAFRGRLGETSSNSYRRVEALPSWPLDFRHLSWARFLAAAARRWGDARLLAPGRPPEGPARRPWVHACLPPD